MSRRTFINLLAFAILIALLAIFGRAMNFTPGPDVALEPGADSVVTDAAQTAVAGTIPDSIATAAAGTATDSIGTATAAASHAVPPLAALAGEVRHAEIGFTSDAALREHFAKHGADLGAATPEAYVLMAQALRDRPAGGVVLEAVRYDHVVTRFDRASGAFLAFDRDLTIRTFFRPNDGEAYFRRQLAREH